MEKTVLDAPVSSVPSRTPPSKANFVPVPQPGGPQEPLVLSYLGLRKAVGIIGFALPIVLVIGRMILQGPALERTISDYYYTDMGNWFVGSLCAIGVFLMSTRGYDLRDAIAGRLACLFAVGVALFPTSQGSTTPIGAAHWTFAALLFLTLAYFCLVLFTETDPSRPPTVRKRQRNSVYRACGWIILASILSIPLTKIHAVNAALSTLKPVFWLETFAVLAFGFAWLVKGETILGD